MILKLQNRLKNAKDMNSLLKKHSKSLSVKNYYIKQVLNLHHKHWLA